MTEKEIRPIAENYVEEFCHDIHGEYDDGSLICAGIGTALIVARKLEKQIEEIKQDTVWHYVKDGDYPKDKKPVLCILGDVDSESYEVGCYDEEEKGEPWHFETYDLPDDDGDNAWGVSAWQKINPPKVKQKE